MIFNHVPAGILPETNLVRFAYWDDYADLFVRDEYGWKILPDMRHWLLVHTPNAKVVLDCGETGESEPKAHINFPTKAEAEVFIAKWGKSE